MSKYDVFISYSSKDKETAFYLCEKLEERNLRCWIAPRDEVAGISYAKQILNAISESTVMVVCFSENANQSEHVESEIDNAFSSGKVIIPFRIDDCVMSPEMKYYLNKKHWLVGIPVDEKSIEELTQSVISNIPERARAREMEHSIDNAITMVEDIIVKSDDREVALNLSEDDAYQNRLEKLKTLNSLVKDMEASVLLGKYQQKFFLRNKESLVSRLGEGGYDMFVNDANELMLFIGPLEGNVDNPRFITDGSSKAMLYKNPRSARMLNDLTEECAALLKARTSVLVCEVGDSAAEVATYVAEVEVECRLEELAEFHWMDDVLLFEPSDNPKRFDLLMNDKNELLLIVNAAPGRPEDSTAVFCDDKILLIKNSRESFVYEPVGDAACEVLKDEQITVVQVVETYKNRAVARYTARLLKPEKVDWQTLLSGDDTGDHGRVPKPLAYVPDPVDTHEVELPDELSPLIEAMAKNVHEVWSQNRMSEGWTYGPVRDDLCKKHPCLIPYEELPDSEKEYDRATSQETLKLILKSGFAISKK